MFATPNGAKIESWKKANLAALKRIAQPPDLIGGQLRPKNAAWLSKQQQKERDYKRRAAAERYERESKDGSNRRAYGVASESILAQE